MIQEGAAILEIFTECFGASRVSRYLWVVPNAVPSLGRMCQNIGTTLRVLFGLDPLESHHKIRNKYIVTRTANFGGKQNEESNDDAHVLCYISDVKTWNKAKETHPYCLRKIKRNMIKNMRPMKAKRSATMIVWMISRYKSKFCIA
eukprot:854909_1